MTNMKQHLFRKSIPLLLLACVMLACSSNAQLPAPTEAPVEAPVETPAPAPEAEEIEIGAETVTTPVVTEVPLPTLPPTPSPSPEPTPTPEPTPSPTPLPLSGVIIGLDPGHQRVYDPKPEPVSPGSSQTKKRVDGGCRGVKSGVYEYEVAMNVGLYLRDLLEAQGATVVMTHDTLDVNISNAERAQLFNEANVDLGIRLHCNKSEKRETRGAFMLVPTETRTKYYEYNVAAAKTILAAYLAETGLPMRYKEGMTYRSDQTGFNWCTRPIINIEMGHLSNPDDDALLSTDAFQQTMAQGLCNGILQFFAEHGRAD